MNKWMLRFIKQYCLQWHLKHEILRDKSDQSCVRPVHCKSQNIAEYN